MMDPSDRDHFLFILGLACVAAVIAIAIYFLTG